jgi:hypothetical protein
VQSVAKDSYPRLVGKYIGATIGQTTRWAWMTAVIIVTARLLGVHV